MPSIVPGIFEGLSELGVLVCFVLLQQKTRDWIIYKEQKFIFSVLEAGSPRSRGQHLTRAYLLCHPMVEGKRAKRGQERETKRGLRSPFYNEPKPAVMTLIHL